MPSNKREWMIAGLAAAALLVLATATAMTIMPLERQGMVTADAPAHASAGIDTFTHEDLHAEPLRKGDKL
jgi:hypothetical protein